MTGDVNELIHAHLDGTLDPVGEGALGAWLANPDNARAFAAVALLHDRLRSVLVVAPGAAPPAPAEPASPARPRLRSRLAPVVVAGSLVAAVAVTLAVWLLAPAPVTAAAELERLIEAADTGDRVYRITGLDPNPLPIEPRQAPIDGATLYVRAPDRYVLVRRFPDGREYPTGFDGERNWAALPDGAVRLSRDPLRFRWALPGHQHGIPFADLRSDLVQLRDAYTVTPLAADAAGRRGLLAVKKSREYRGPNQVELWYDGRTGVIHRMVFEGLPKARGGPDSVSVDLLEQRDLGPDFFKHESHHGPNRRVVEED